MKRTLEQPLCALTVLFVTLFPRFEAEGGPLSFVAEHALKGWASGRHVEVGESGRDFLFEVPKGEEQWMITEIVALAPSERVIVVEQRPDMQGKWMVEGRLVSEGSLRPRVRSGQTIRSDWGTTKTTGLGILAFQDAKGRPVGPGGEFLTSPVEGFPMDEGEGFRGGQAGTKGLFLIQGGRCCEITEAPYDWVYRFSVYERSRKIFVETGEGFLLYDLADGRRWTFPYFDVPENAGGAENHYYYVPGHDFLLKQANHLGQRGYDYTGFQISVVDYERRTLQQIDLGPSGERRPFEPVDVACSELMIGIVGIADGRCVVRVYAIEER